MCVPQGRRWAVVAAILLALSPVLAAPPKREVLTGKVVPLADVVQTIGSKLDADASAHWLALTTDDGKIYPLIKDSGARMFFTDKTLLRRPMRLTGRLVPGSQLLQVLEVRSLHKGEEFDVYYWCDICSIRRNEKLVCECCGGPMELKEEPVRK